MHLSKLDELLASVTPEDGIREDFIEGVREAYASDVAEIGAAHEASTNELTATHAAAVESLNSAHAEEIERIKNDRYEKTLFDDEADSATDSVGDEIDEEITFENYWTEAE